jgi:hypothetical protein
VGRGLNRETKTERLINYGDQILFKSQTEEEEYPKGRRYRRQNKNGDIHSEILTANGVKRRGG